MQEGADFIIAETFGELAEAKLALECIKDVKKGQKRGQLRYSCGYIDHPTATSRTTLENPIDCHLDARPEKFVDFQEMSWKSTFKSAHCKRI